ncbi:glutathione synthetase [Solemya velum gill symbiont]|uniref:glutathione synthetase n=1 Tax=Solemya velum gill symbiont TaxID=2340 RepID=UPI0009982DE6|nr:glutathione synthetase [Solemya velum gill symbiont]OOY98875.1 glutathione synthetase [Solemya velum gill symbiont]OOZ01153.1 glutathione synthetase [Solemya velum gill symbiont]OOZ03354.1 glutathione synthetase [Solemya velum gill symbiont]OOZ05654.1 glutathione synthetase [Solemya velum gill symbiont]OOZ07881.1 glutathione synthetase [Solemya velum gill symbiont]
MRLAMVVNNINTEVSDYTTTVMAMRATNMGHEVWYIDVAEFDYAPDHYVYARARRVPDKKYRSLRVYLESLRSQSAYQERICATDLDVLMLRNDPAEDVMDRPWARLAGINFGRLAMQHGVIVLNDPNGLTHAVNKMYLQYFPEEVRPRTLISRDKDEIKAFIDEEGGRGVLKPITGSGGRNVFLVQPEDKPNINQMIEAVSREGYVIAQEYLPDASHGDIRLFLMNGDPLCSKGKYAAFRRQRKKGDWDMRSNITAGAVAVPVQIDETILALAESVRTKLIQDGMFLVGLDIVGDKLMEINVFSPGGLMSMGQMEECHFCCEIILSLERKVEYLRNNPGSFDNVKLATL